MDLYDEIYFSLVGELREPLAWVPNAFAPGSPCDTAYAELLLARDRVLEKLGQETDPDLSRMLEEMEIIQHTLCREIMALRL